MITLLNVTLVVVGTVVITGVVVLAGIGLLFVVTEVL